ncbi:maker313 [Drosophila busckii]|uniref:Maker313 n=2 Tax=Drosophila busckii TaxID=30019 RepID=A0A0M3QZ77_DROBS|nr:maker313 [Drosophila busckii]
MSGRNLNTNDANTNIVDQMQSQSEDLDDQPGPSRRSANAEMKSRFGNGSAKEQIRGLLAKLKSFSWPFGARTKPCAESLSNTLAHDPTKVALVKRPGTALSQGKERKRRIAQLKAMREKMSASKDEKGATFHALRQCLCTEVDGKIYKL